MDTVSEKMRNMIETTYNVVENFDGFPEFVGVTYVSYDDNGNAKVEAEDFTGGLDSFFSSYPCIVLGFSNSRTIEEVIEYYFEINF